MIRLIANKTENKNKITQRNTPKIEIEKQQNKIKVTINEKRRSINAKKEKECVLISGYE